MGAFEYQALNTKGNTVKGVTNGDHARQVREELRAQGLSPLEVREISARQANNKKGGVNAKTRRLKISGSDLSILTRQMATLINSGMTIEETLNAMINQSEGHKVKTIMSDLKSLVTEGQSLSEAIATYPKSFPEIYHSSIYAGEQSGTLGDVMERLADYLENRQSMQQKVSTALIYPVFLTIICVLIVIALVAFVVPQVVRVFEDSDQQLPMLTRGVIWFSETLQTYGLALLILFGVLFLGLKFIFSQEGPKRWLHGLFLKLPGIKRMTRNLNASRMARTLSILVSSGVPLLTSMKASEGVMSNVVLRKDLARAAEEVSQGVSISRALDKSSHFPPLIVQMVASGENSGKLDHMLDKAATATENEVQTRIAMMVGIFEPTMILIMGVVVLLIVMAILLPIFELTNVLN